MARIYLRQAQLLTNDKHTGRYYHMSATILQFNAASTIMLNNAYSSSNDKVLRESYARYLKYQHKKSKVATAASKEAEADLYDVYASETEQENEAWKYMEA